MTGEAVQLSTTATYTGAVEVAVRYDEAQLSAPETMVKLLRRVLAALVMAGVAAAGIRLRGSGGGPPQHGGWRPLELPPDRP